MTYLFWAAIPLAFLVFQEDNCSFLVNLPQSPQNKFQLGHLTSIYALENPNKISFIVSEHLYIQFLVMQYQKEKSFYVFRYTSANLPRICIVTDWKLKALSFLNLLFGTDLDGLTHFRCWVTATGNCVRVFLCTLFLLLLFVRMLCFPSLPLRKPVIVISTHSFHRSTCFIWGAGDVNMNKTWFLLWKISSSVGEERYWNTSLHFKVIHSV